MKNKIYKITILFVFVVVGLMSCEENDNEKEWGNALVYMPQATIQDGGLNNTYPVPFDNNPATKNYEIDEETNTMQIYLGVYRSGLQSLESFSVQVGVNEEATLEAVAAINRGVALPKDVYSLSDNVVVPKGEREAVFSLTVDLNKLETDYASYNLSKLVLVVEISNPSKYKLNESLCKTTIVINGSSFLPAPKIVKGGDFSPDSRSFWTLLNLDETGVFNESVAVIQDGRLALSFGSHATGNIAFFQPISLKNGSKYILSVDFAASGGADNGQFFVCISDVEPQEHQYYEMSTGIFSNIDVWQGKLIEPMSGKLPQDGTWEGGIEKGTGVFTANFSGQAYIILDIACWNGSVGTITVNNVSIEEY